MSRRGFQYEMRRQVDEVPGAFEYGERLFLMKDVFSEGGGPLHRYVSCYDMVYVLVIEWNSETSLCFENRILGRMYSLMEEKDMEKYREGMKEVLKDFMKECWGFLGEDYGKRLETGRIVESDALDFGCRRIGRIELKTELSGRLVGKFGDGIFDDEGFTGVCFDEKKYGKMICFEKKDVVILEQVDLHGYRVKVKGEEGEYCLKAGRMDYISGIEKLSKIGELRIENLARFGGIVVSEDRRVIGYLMEFISGELLCDMGGVIRSGWKEKWIKGLYEAVKRLHKNDITWGDAKASNVMINKENMEAIIIDLDGGYSGGWVDREDRNTKKGDEKGLESINLYIENI